MKNFVVAKVRSLLAVQPQNEEDAGALAEFKNASGAFHRVFRMPPQEKLINYYSCSYWRKSTGGVPRQGWMYISDNHVCFNSLIMGKETTVALPWTSVMLMELRTKMLLADGVCVGTRCVRANSCHSRPHVLPRTSARRSRSCADSPDFPGQPPCRHAARQDG